MRGTSCWISRFLCNLGLPQEERYKSLNYMLQLRKEEQRVAYQKTPTWWIMQYCPLNRGKGKCSICGKNNWELFLKRQIFCSLIPFIKGQILEILSKDHGVILSSQIRLSHGCLIWNMGSIWTARKMWTERKWWMLIFAF